MGRSGPILGAILCALAGQSAVWAHPEPSPYPEAIHRPVSYPDMAAEALAHATCAIFIDVLADGSTRNPCAVCAVTAPPAMKSALSTIQSLFEEQLMEDALEWKFRPNEPEFDYPVRSQLEMVYLLDDEESFSVPRAPEPNTQSCELTPIS